MTLPASYRPVRIERIWKRLPEAIKALLVLTAVLVTFAYPFFFQGKHFSPMDLLYRFDPWKAVAPDWYQQPSNALRWDDATKFYPERVNLIRNFKQDGLTFWQTDHLAGTPNRPTLHRYGLLFYPLVWLFFVLPFNTANSLIHISNLLIAGISMWLLLREHKLSQIPSLLGAIAYMLNGFFVVWMSAFFLPGMLALLPLLCFLYERLLRRQKFAFVLALALAIALQFYLGYPPGSVLLVAYFGLYCLVSFSRLYIQGERRIAFRTMSLTLLAGLIALALAALYLIPTAEQLSNSEYMIARGQARPSSIPLEHLLGYVFPNLWGNPTGAMGGIWTGWQNYCEIIAYWGIVPLLAAAIGLVIGKKQGQLYLFAVSSLTLSISMAYGLQPLVNLRFLPGITGINVTRWQFGIVFGGCMLAAVGMEHLLSLQRQERKFAVITIALAGIALGYITAAAASPSHIQAQYWGFPLLMQSHYRQIGLIATCLIFLLGYAWFHQRISPGFFGLLALGLTVSDLLAFGIGFNPFLNEDELYPTTPGIRFLQSQADFSRVAPLGSWFGIFPAYSANVYGVSVVTGMDHYRDRTYQAFLKPLMSETSYADSGKYGYVRVDQGFGDNHTLLDMLNVQYVVTEPGQDTWTQFNTVYRGPDITILENSNTLPGAWGVSQFELTSNSQALSGIHEPAFDPRQLVLLEQDPSLQGSSSPCNAEGLESEVVGYAQDEIVVEVDFACAGVLVFAERFADDWKATVDGSQTDVLRANYLLRAVTVPAGKHTVHLYYRPAANMWGLGISLFSFILFCGMIGFTWKRWRGATVLSITIPTLAILWFARPWQQPPPPSERWVQVDGPERPEIAPHAQQAIFRDEHGEIRFLGYELNKTALAPGETLRLTLLWQGKVPTKQDYTVFTHLIDESGQLCGQDDHPPLDGQAPTSTWQNGQIISDIYRLTVDPRTTAETAQVRIGMYDWRTGERLPLFSLTGDRLQGDALTLEIPIQMQR